MIIGIDANEANVKNRVGSNQFAFQILQKLNQTDKQNQYLIFLKNPPLKDLPGTSPNWQYRVLKPAFLWTQWRLPLGLFFQSPRLNIFLTLGHYAPRFSPTPVLISIMDLAFIKYPDQFLKKDLIKLIRWTKYSVKKAKHIFTISRATKKDLIKFYHLPSSKITVTYPSITQIKKSTQFNIKGDYLLYLGTLQPRKNIPALISAFSQIQHQFPDLKLVIAGKKGWLYQSIFNKVQDLNLTSKVIFTGYVETSKLKSMITKARLLILPSLYEGFGIPVLKAMSLGTPVLVAKNSSLKEIVRKTGYYINPPFDARQTKQGIITALTDSKSNQQILIRNAKKRAQDFSWEKSAKKILEVLNENTF